MEELFNILHAVYLAIANTLSGIASLINYIPLMSYAVGLRVFSLLVDRVRKLMGK